MNYGREGKLAGYAVGAQWGKVHCNIKVQFTEDEGRNLPISLLPLD
jgi:hypothetical protein